jgi:lipoprotein NlpD
MKQRHLICISFLMVFCFLSEACLRSGVLAPVVGINDSHNLNSTRYIVKKGDTLYSIAWALGMDYRDIARWNSLHSPYMLTTGQILHLTSTQSLPKHTQSRPEHTQSPPKHTQSPPKHTQGPLKHKQSRPEHVSKLSSPHQQKRKKTQRQLFLKKGQWAWPARGKVIGSYNGALGKNQGVNISGQYDSPVRASAPGVVVYSGTGVRGYGNLIIIRHSSSVLSAYAFNHRSFVRVGEKVAVGQEIAKMGRSPSGEVMLHFEVRYDGRPVNPLRYLKA